MARHLDWRPSDLDSHTYKWAYIAGLQGLSMTSLVKGVWIRGGYAFRRDLLVQKIRMRMKFSFLYTRLVCIRKLYCALSFLSSPHTCLPQIIPAEQAISCLNILFIWCVSSTGCPYNLKPIIYVRDNLITEFSGMIALRIMHKEIKDMKAPYLLRTNNKCHVFT